MFITFEGIEGAGKTTQIQYLARYFESKSRSVVITREPGGTAVGQQIREWILNAQTTFQSDLTELFLFFADRFEHIETIIKPALAEGKVVLCDRYVDSTVAYQVGARGLDEDAIQTIVKLLPLMPDYTLLLDLPVEEGLKRAKNRASLDRFEQESSSFHTQVRNKFLDIASKNPQRVLPFNVVGKEPEALFQMIKTKLYDVGVF